MRLRLVCDALSQVLGLFKIPRPRCLFLVYILFDYNLNCFSQKQKSKKVKTIFSIKDLKYIIGALKMAALNRGAPNQALTVEEIVELLK